MADVKDMAEDVPDVRGVAPLLQALGPILHFVLEQ